MEVRALRDSSRRLRGMGCEGAWPAARRRLASEVRALRAAASGAGRGVPAAHGGRVAKRVACTLQRLVGGSERQGREHRHAQGVTERHRRPGADAAGADRWLCGLGRLQPDALVGCETNDPRWRQLYLLRCARVRHVGDPQWACAARRDDPFWGNLSDFLGLRAQCAAHGRADARWQHIRLYPRLYRAGRRRTHTPAYRTRGEPALHSPHGSLAAVRHDRDNGRLVLPPSNAGPGRLHCCCRAKTCRFRRAPPISSRSSSAAATCCPRLPGAARV